MEDAFKTVFWALFGLTDHDVVELGNGYNSSFTERVGYFIFGLYNIVTVIVLLNMLIAMMSRSFSKIQVMRITANVEGNFPPKTLNF